MFEFLWWKFSLVLSQSVFPIHSQDCISEGVWLDGFSMCLSVIMVVTVTAPRGHSGLTLAYSPLEQKADMISQTHKRER